MVRESLYGFPILVGIHILGLVLSVGTLVWFDLRLVGVALQSAAVSRVYRRLIPWATCGFGVMFVTGALLFTGYASAAYQNPFFRIKMSALALAGLNALLYHLVTERGRNDWDAAQRPPRAARAAGIVSIALWAVVIMCGRIMSYTMY
jgi:hypothetical protein